jgi:hypothetical protein
VGTSKLLKGIRWYNVSTGNSEAVKKAVIKSESDTSKTNTTESKHHALRTACKNEEWKK